MRGRGGRIDMGKEPEVVGGRKGGGTSVFVSNSNIYFSLASDMSNFRSSFNIFFYSKVVTF